MSDVEEKTRVNETVVRAIDGRVPVVAGIAGLATAECVAFAKASEKVGCDGIMALELANAITLSSHAERAVTLPIDRAEYSALLKRLRNP